MRSPILRFVVILVGLVVAVLLRWLLDPVLGDALPLVTMFGAVAGAAWLGGIFPAVTVCVLGYFACAYLFIPPRGDLGLNLPANLVGFIAYLFTCILIIGFAQTMRSARRRADERGEVLRVTLRSIGDAVITTGNDGRITNLNAVAESLTGWTSEEALGRPLEEIFRIVNEETRQPVENPATRALRDGVIVGLANHTLLIRKDGTELAIDDSAAPIINEEERVSGCVLIFRDVTAQRRLEREKATQLLTARRLASIVESSDDAIVGKSLDGVIQSWNRGAERLFGYTADKAIGQHISLIIPPERIAEEDQIIASLRAGDRIDHFETERVRSDGQHVNVSLTISPIKDATGTVVGASKIARDITERIQAEADRAKLVTLVENSTDFIGMCDLNGMPFFVNRAGLEMVGLDDLEAARRTPLASFFFAEDQPTISNELLPVVLEKGHGEIEIRFRHFKTGDALWMVYKVLLLRDTAGQPQAFATVSQDITGRRQMEDNLRRLAADLSEADRRKNEFLATLAHELRNPLAPISNAVKALRLGGNDESVRSASEMLERQVAQMARLVDDLLDMSRITRGKIELRLERVELATIVNQAVEAARVLYSTMNHELTVSVPLQPIHLRADATRLTQVIGNLLNNACKFTDKGGHVWLTVEREGLEAIVRVRDNGIGIAPEHLPRLFQMFSQIDTSLERSRDGLGIGLTLVKTLVEMQGGSVSAHSEGPGRGSEFVVRLPILVEQAPQLTSSGQGATPAAPGRRILVVDDNEDGATSLSLLLRLGGHETHMAHDGLEAMELAERLRPDVVLLDIGLPRLNGFEVCRRLRDKPWGGDLIIVALTGWGQDEDRRRSREAGFDSHIVKPVDHEVLMKLLASLFEEKESAGR